MLDTHLRQPAPSLAPWPMLLAFTLGFAMSNAFRTVAAILAPPLQADMGLSPQQLGVFAGAFHFAFGALQLFVGIGMDVHGPRRTVLAVSPLAVAGAVLAACATGFPMLLAAQVLIGIGCAPAFVACTIFISRRFPAGRFAAVSGQVLGIGSAGMLLTGTPLAWLVEHLSWRAGFAALAVGSTLGWLAVLLLVQEAPQGEASRVRLGEALRGYGELLRQPHTWGIVALGACTYASFMALRGLWLGPLLVERHGFSLVASGNVALAVSALAIVALPLFGRLDPGDIHRRRWIVGHTLLLAAMFALLAFSRSAWLDVGIALAMSVATGFIVWQYADVRAAYPARMTGRAMAVFTMAMFLGVAVVQWLTGLGASLAAQWQMDVFATVFAGLAALLLLGAAAFAGLPAPPRRA